MFHGENVAEVLYSVYVGNLPLSVSLSHLREIFEEYGTIGNLFLQTPENGMVYTYAFVRYTAEDSAIAAVHDMRGKRLDNNKLVVDFSNMPLYPGRKTKSSGVKKREKSKSSKLRTCTLPEVDQKYMAELMLAFRSSYIDSNGHHDSTEEDLKRAWNKLMNDFKQEGNAPCEPYTRPATGILLDTQELERLCKIDGKKEKEELRLSQLPKIPRNRKLNTSRSAETKEAIETEAGRLPVRVCNNSSKQTRLKTPIKSEALEEISVTARLGVPQVDEEPTNWDIHVPLCPGENSTSCS